MPGSGLLLLVDLDGVLYRGAAPVPGVAALLATRAAAGDDVVYVTNNSMWYRADYVDRIAAMGAPVTADRIVSSPRATALYLADHEAGVRHVLTVGERGLDRELEDAGLRVTRAGDAGERIRGGGIEGTDGGSGWEAAGRPDAVVVGLDPKIDYLRLTVASDCIRAGARFVATNRDPVYPTERAVRPGAGSIVAAIEAASGVTPISIGKPEPYLLEEAARVVGRPADEAVMIGDNLGTDIAAARAFGARSVLMLTGVTTRDDVAGTAEDARPTAVAADAAELGTILDRLART
ncbi:MAG TPA: HAD-IIA family hydrolase [Candidatus Limnocylindrales bacterium]|nr:HAD-IIA family hydrolase [Candidatus Limnocylindrales bacterium]